MVGRNAPQPCGGHLMRIRKKVLSVFLSLVLAIGLCPATAFASTFNEVNSASVWLKQKTNYTCTLSSAAMMLRRAAMMNGDSGWSSITEDSIKSIAWCNSGLKWSFTYRNLRVGHGTLPGGSSNTARLISLLNNHQEGIVVYATDIPHAVLLTDYSNGRFYCCDPLTGYKKELNSAWKVRTTNIKAYWYIASSVSR